MSALTCCERFWEDLSLAPATAVPLQDKKGSMAGHRPPPHSLAWLGPLLVAEVAGLGLGLQRPRTLSRGIRGTPAEYTPATATRQLWKTALRGYVAHRAEESEGAPTHQDPSCGQLPVPLGQGTVYSDAEDS